MPYGNEAEIDQLLATMPKWSISTLLDTAYGYRDNVLLSALEEESSPFVRGVAEFLLLRLPTGAFEYTFFLQGEHTRFLRKVAYIDPATAEISEVDHEARIWAQSEVGYRVSETLRFGLPVTGYYTDQVFDVSSIETRRDVAALSVLGGFVAPVARWAFLPSWWV
ncbi:MAG: hypothetical protein V4773_15720, partial [Verrucomicrobiota bacterium]